jgi:hypothetical protein
VSFSDVPIVQDLEEARVAVWDQLNERKLSGKAVRYIHQSPCLTFRHYLATLARSRLLTRLKELQSQGRGTF